MYIMHSFIIIPKTSYHYGKITRYNGNSTKYVPSSTLGSLDLPQ